MASTLFTAFLPEVLPHVGGCPEISAIIALRNAAIEFCEGSLYWQERTDANAVTATDLPLDIENPSGARVVQVISAFVDGVSIAPKTIAQLESEYGRWQSDTGDGTLAFYQLGPAQLYLYPTPVTSVSLVVTSAHAPTRAATGMDSQIAERYMEAIASGALARLMMVPGKAWSNPQAATYHRSLFESAMTKGKVAAVKGFTRAVLSLQPRAFGFG